MSMIVSSIGTNNPEYYAELLSKCTRSINQRTLSNCPDVPCIQGVDGPLTRRLQALLDILAGISLCQHGNVSATMASFVVNKGTLETQLFLVFNHQNDEAAGRCPGHLRSIFDMLRKAPYKPPAMGGSPEVIAEELESDLIEICRTIHNFSFDVFARRVTKRKPRLSDIRAYVDQMDLTPNQRSTMAIFFQHVDQIIEIVDHTKATKQVPPLGIQMLLDMYSYWTKHNILPQDALDENKVTLLDHVDTWLADEHPELGFRLRHWALKIMSFVISTNSLFILTQSSRLRNLLKGTFSVEVLPSPPTTRYRCDLSSQNIQVALDAALAGTSRRSANWAEDCRYFIQRILKGKGAIQALHLKPTVHAELAMIMAMDKSKIKRVEPYIGVSKLSCIMCSHFIRAFNEVTEQKISTRGSHGKGYPGWSWPHLPRHDGKMRPAFLRYIRQQLRNDFELHTKTRLLSDSSVGSGGPRLEKDPTEVQINELYNRFFNRVVVSP